MPSFVDNLPRALEEWALNDDGQVDARWPGGLGLGIDAIDDGEVVGAFFSIDPLALPAGVLNTSRLVLENRGLTAL